MRPGVIEMCHFSDHLSKYPPVASPPCPLLSVLLIAQGRGQHREQGSEKSLGAALCAITCAAFSATWEETIV